jgi:hypothetical protein
MSNLLGLLGYALQWIDYLRLISRISNDRSAQADSKSTPDLPIARLSRRLRLLPPPQTVHIRVSGQLGTEYLKNSKISLARSVFSSTNALIPKLVLEGGDISLATRHLCKSNSTICPRKVRDGERIHRRKRGCLALVVQVLLIKKTRGKLLILLGMGSNDGKAFRPKRRRCLRYLRYVWP